MSGGQRTLIEEIATVKGGKRLPEGAAFANAVTDHPYIRARDIGGNRITFDEPVYLDERTFAKLKNYTVSEGDVVVTIVGANIGDVGLVKQDFDGANLTENAAKISVDRLKCDPRFLSFQLSMPHSKEKFRLLTGGAAQGKLGLYKIKSFEVLLPLLPVQQRVSQILSAYDDLIENNRRRIALLEQSARLLYREWFVFFRFPGHEHVKVIDGCPKSWKRKRIGDICTFLGRGISPIYDDDGESLVVNQKCIRNRMLSLEQARRQKKEYKAEKSLRHLDVLINSTGTGTLGRVAQCWFCPTNTTFDSHVTVARATEEVNRLWFGYALLDLESVFEGMGEGATNQKELSRSRIADTCLIAPPNELQEYFGSFASDTATQVRILQDQNQNLVAARDLLLPRLMNGEIAV